MPGSADNGARAIGLCKFISEGDSGWGVLSARFTTASGVGTPNPLQSGVLPSFGSATPLQGSSLLALSSGVARAPGQANFTSGCDVFDVMSEFDSEAYAPGFPIASPACPGVRAGDTYNSVALEVRIRVPSNAQGFRFNSNFYTYEYPVYICDEFNDFFAVLQQTDGGSFENIVFDTNGDAVSVNNALLQVCTPGNHGGRQFDCPLGRDLLTGTGFDGTSSCGGEGDFSGPASEAGGATGWLTTTVPVVGGSVITLRFAIWDSGDPILDSLTVIDGFEWELEEIVGDAPVTEPLI